MKLDFSKIVSKEIEEKVISPRGIFMSLPNRDSKYDYPRDVQKDVWDSWYEKRNEKDLIIKMNTGSGKTVVGLLILKSCIEEKKGPAIYVVPTQYLVKQVIDEANKLGLDVTDNYNSPEFLRGKAILVINIHTLINGKSVFGLRETDNIPIGSVLIDDVHACLETTNQQFTIRIARDTDLYESLMKIFKRSLKQQSESMWLNLEDNEPASMLLPYWCWQDNISEINRLLHNHRDDEELLFKYALINESLNNCNCVCTNRWIEISPKSIPINRIVNFENAKRRIFMSATLSDDSPFVSHFNIDYKNMNNVITPENADDIGERMILIPEAINSNITKEEEKRNLALLSKTYNTVVIVPSDYKAKYWSDVADEIVSKDNLEDVVKRLKNGHVGLVVFSNKYEGIDLPEDACRILVIDGISEVQNGIDTIERKVLANSSKTQSSIIQRIEQGMGRGIRSNKDYCLVFLLGKDLTKLLYVNNAIDKFSIATKKQLELSDRVSDMLKGMSANEIFNTARETCLERDDEWRTLSKTNLANVKYDNNLNIDPTIIAIRKAFEYAEGEEYSRAVSVLKETLNNEADSAVKGWLKEQMAEYTNFIDKEESQKILLSAYKENKRIIKPIKGIQFSKGLNKYSTQAKELVEYINRENLNKNKYIITLNSVLDNLKFEPNTADIFEQSIKELGNLIGFKGSRPENDYGKGPDNLWQMNDDDFLVIECKNGVINNTICKRDCNQLNGSIEWFKNNYGKLNKRCTPIMIHLGNCFEYSANPNSEIRIILPEKLELLKKRVKDFSTYLVSNNNFNNVENITKGLRTYKISKEYFVREYTIDYKVQVNV